MQAANVTSSGVSTRIDNSCFPSDYPKLVDSHIVSAEATTTHDSASPSDLDNDISGRTNQYDQANATVSGRCIAMR